MRACIIAVNSGHERYMGYATYHRTGGMSLKSSNIPVITSNKNLLIGVDGSEQLLTDLSISPIMVSMDNEQFQVIDTVRRSIRHVYPLGSQALLLTSNNFMYHWHDGKVDLYGEFDEDYLAIGPGAEIAMGTIYGLRSSRFTVKEQVEIAIKAVSRFYPELGKSTGVIGL